MLGWDGSYSIGVYGIGGFRGELARCYETSYCSLIIFESSSSNLLNDVPSANLYIIHLLGLIKLNNFYLDLEPLAVNLPNHDPSTHTLH
jgi:hypothetical protein